MNATVTATPYKMLHKNEQRILDELREGSKTTYDLVQLVGRNYHPVNRSLKNLEAKGWVEPDYSMNSGKEKYYKLRKAPTEGIELVIKTKLESQSVSFNRYFETVAIQLGGGVRPGIFDEVESYYKAIAYLAAMAAKEYADPGTVTEANLLEIRNKIQNFVEELKSVFHLGIQILDNEDFWHAKTLATGILRKTDRHLPPSQIITYSKMILDSFKTEESSASTEVESIEETEEAEEFSNDE